MGNNTSMTAEQMKKLGYVEDGAGTGKFVHISKLAPKGKIDKLPNLLERAIDAEIMIPKGYTDAQRKAIENVDFKNHFMPVKNSYALTGQQEQIVPPHVAMKAFIKNEFDKFKTVKNGEFTYHLQDPFKENKPLGNKKVKNATKSTNDAGIKFDSNLERYMYDLLTGSKIDFEFQKTFELQRKFKYRDENIRAISKVVDFYLPTRNIIIDTKGYENDVSPMKHKMLKSVLKHLHDMQPEIIMPKNKKECDLLLNKLLYQK